MLAPILDTLGRLDAFLQEFSLNKINAEVHVTLAVLQAVFAVHL